MALDALDDFAEDVRGSDDDDDGDGGGADADALSFGGGLFTKTAEGNGDGGEGAERPRTHKEIMAEVIAKSKVRFLWWKWMCGVCKGVGVCVCVIATSKVRRGGCVCKGADGWGCM